MALVFMCCGFGLVGFDSTYVFFVRLFFIAVIPALLVIVFVSSVSEIIVNSKKIVVATACAAKCYRISEIRSIQTETYITSSFFVVTICKVNGKKHRHHFTAMDTNIGSFSRTSKALADVFASVCSPKEVHAVQQ